MANARTCPQCGAGIKEEDMFCGKCGARLTQSGATGGRRDSGQGAHMRARASSRKAPAHFKTPYVAPTHASHAAPPEGRRGLRALVAVTCVLAVLVIVVAGVLYAKKRLPLPWDARPTGGYEAIAAEASGLPSVDATLVSLDATDFPTMRAYVRLTESGAAAGLSSPKVALLEGVSDGQVLEREVRSAMRVSGAQGMSYGIAVDKSGSMGDAMPRVREILSEFVGGLDYGAGDRAELLSFDTYVMWMCAMTGEADRLQSGLSSMEPWGETALWDALYESVESVGAQAGVRCVVALTDGVDNSSSRGPDDVASLAESLGVPVFIVGTAEADEATLRDLASRCGGAYLPIADVEGLSQALAEVRGREEGLWCIEYDCDGTSAADASRQLSLVASDGSHGCRLEAQAVPVQRAVAQQPHASRYELVRADASWTEANAECMRRGGHLATITSQEEMDAVTAMCEGEDIRFCWLGGYTSVRGDQAFGHWVTGEAFDFAPWRPGEPSRTDRDGTPEMYLILWKPQEDEGWSFNDERDRPFEDEEMQYMYGNMGYVCEWEDEDVATAPVVTKSAKAAAQAASEPVALAGGGFTFRVPDALAAYEGVELANDDKGLPCVSLSGRPLLWFDTDLAQWESSGSRDVAARRHVAAGTLQVSEYNDNAVMSCLTAPDGRRLMVWTHGYGPTTRVGLGEDVALAHRDCQAAACGMGADDDPLRIAMEFLFLCANGVTFDDAVPPEPASQPSSPYVITIDKDYPPMSYTADDGTFSGMEVELLAAVAHDQGFEYELDPVAWDTVSSNVKSGKADAIISVSPDNETFQEYDFSDSYYQDEGEEGQPFIHCLAVRRGTNAGLLQKFNAGLANIRANGTYDEIVRRYATTEPESGSGAASGEVRVVDEGTFEIGNMRFTLPEYWRGKMDLAVEDGGIKIYLAGTDTLVFHFNYAPVGGSYYSANAKDNEVSWDSLNGYYEGRLASPSSYDEYPLSDGTTAFEFAGADGFTESLYKTADDGLIDCRSYYLKDPSFYEKLEPDTELERMRAEYSQMQDLMSMGGEADAGDYSSYPSHLWARATRV